MPRQLSTHTAPQLTRRQLRNLAVAAAAAIALAAGGYGAAQTLGPNANSPETDATTAHAPTSPVDQTKRQMRDAIAGQYGTHPGTTKTARAQARREMRHTVANLYRPAATTAPNSHTQAMREMRDTVTKLYGDSR